MSEYNLFFTDTVFGQHEQVLNFQKKTSRPTGENKIIENSIIGSIANLTTYT